MPRPSRDGCDRVTQIGNDCGDDSTVHGALDEVKIRELSGRNADYKMPKNKSNLSTDRLLELARAGAEVTLKRMRAEIIAIERAFPELQLPAGRRALRRSFKQVRTRTRTMSAEARKAVSARMKRYWAERRKAQARVK
jgi:hypothetical protein